MAPLEVSWSAIYETAYLNLEESLKSTVRLAQQKDNHIVSVFTNTSHEFLADIVTQTIQLEAEKLVTSLNREPLALLEENVSQMQVCRPVCRLTKKEAFPMVNVRG